jgi:hypothetical protein
VKRGVHIIEQCSEIVDPSVMVVSITAVLRSHELDLSFYVGAQGGSQFGTRWEVLAAGNAVCPTLYQGVESALTDLEVQVVTLKANYLW